MQKARITLLIILVFIIPAGFYTKMYTGPGSVFIHNHAGGILYEIFFVLLILVVFPRAKPAMVAGGVFVATSAIEFLQLVHYPFLEHIRDSFLGAALIGSSFSARDFPWYIVGCLAGWFIVLMVYGKKIPGTGTGS